MARNHQTGSSSEDEKREYRNRHSNISDEDREVRRKSRDNNQSSESDGSGKEVGRGRESRKERNYVASREKTGRRRDEKRIHGSRDANLGGDSERDDRRQRNGRDDEIEKNEHKSRKDDKDDTGRDRKSRQDDDDEDSRKVEKVERRGHRDYAGEDDFRQKKTDRVKESSRDPRSDRRGRSRRNERGREDDYEEGEYRSENKEDSRKEKYDDREDRRKEKYDGRDRRKEKYDDREDRRKERRSDKGDVKENDTPNVPKPEANVGIDAVANLGRSGGVYIPPFKLARMMKEVEDKSSVEYQRMTWDALRKSINGLVNKVNATNVKNIIPELFAENLIRGRGLFCRSCMKSQMASPGFTDVFAALVAVVNTKFPEVGDLLLRRIILQLQRAYKRNDKVCVLGSFLFPLICCFI